MTAASQAGRPLWQSASCLLVPLMGACGGRPAVGGSPLPVIPASAAGVNAAGEEPAASDEAVAPASVRPDVAGDDDLPGIAVRLADPGLPPRRLLRHRFVAGVEQRVLLRTQTRFGGGAAAPAKAVEQRLRVRIETVAADGNAVVSLTVEPSSAGQARGGEAAPGGADGGAGGRISPRGLVHGDEPRVVSAGVGVPLELTDLVEPLPREPVGFGAQWSARRTRLEAGARVESVTVYELLRLEPDAIELRLQRRQRALPVEGSPLIPVPLAPPPVSAITGQVAITLGQPCSHGWFELRGAVEVPLAAEPIELEARVELLPE